MSLVMCLNKLTKISHFNSSKPGLEKGMRTTVKSSSFTFWRNLFIFREKIETTITQT